MEKKGRTQGTAPKKATCCSYGLNHFKCSAEDEKYKSCLQLDINLLWTYISPCVVFVPCLWPKSLSLFSRLRRLHAAIQTAWSLSLCCCAARCSLVSVKKYKERINLFHFPKHGRRVSFTKPSEDPLWYATTLRAYVTFTLELIGLRSQWYTPDKILIKMLFG